ncbi:DASH family cryptochrome [Hufsiella ginkgonis]|uniref:Cryptochrome DASH n=1 Tax=Hufsiella ginkgonis TaxID=2695274 RepID=A0A7K1Y119_9SPHI|nr:DASH family cryptochrome [Hufsiella ginkgonis]MXV16943.1 DASH family cryptochrome [Hufsiella ginkgonis]
MSEKTILVWFRNDLRIHDNEILSEAVKKGGKVLPVYCFDPRYFTGSAYGTLKTGAIRVRFLLESVADLKRSLKQLGGDLLVVNGRPEELLPEIAQRYHVTEVYHHREVAFEETAISGLVEAALWKLQINLKHFIGHTLYHKEDLPFPIKDIPDVFTTFRKKIERDSNIRPGFDSPAAIEVPVNLEESSIPSINELGFEEPVSGERSVLRFKGGETGGLKRMQEYIWDGDALKNYKTTRNGLVGADYSSKLSPWLALGCLSTRKLYWEIKKYERTRVANDSTYALIFELLWRDYFRFMFKKHGNKFFSEEGFKGRAPETAANQQEMFDKWKNGQTGVPFIDANMHELNSTGFMSNRGRQNTASFLVKELKVNWTWGASYFEEKLIDYSPASNWGNWAYIAGVGNDPRENRHFNVLKQAQEYDPKGDYVRSWIPALAAIPGSQIHKPWELTEAQWRNYGLTPDPVYFQPGFSLV